mmetsp:Transcript_65817/g.109373  ORF Transcript_65817/g.109373 Transcript_65817/m.109373 type:complete len:417 (-) Transcript_65817:551-1801(-)
MGQCKTYFLSAIAVALLSAGSFYCYKHVGLPDWYWEARLPDTVEPLDASDTKYLKKVLFGGEPWLLQCYSGIPVEGQHLPAPFRLHPVFKESLGSLRGHARFGTLDCEKPLPSNKTLVAKLGLIRRTQPLLIFAVAGGKAAQVPAGSVSSAYAVTAWVKPKAQPKVHKVRSQQNLKAVCGGNRPCLLTRFDADSSVLKQLAARFRSLEVVSLGEDDAVQLKWGRGEEVGETLEPHEAIHLGKRITILKPDPEAPKRKGKVEFPPRLIRGFNGDEDLPSLSLFVNRALDTTGSDGFMQTLLPSVEETKKAKRQVVNDNAEVQARRARKRAEQRAVEETKEAERNAQKEDQQKHEQRLKQQREAARRAKMAEEEERAGNIVEEVDELEEVNTLGDEGDADAQEEELVEIDEEIMDLDT